MSRREGHQGFDEKIQRLHNARKSATVAQKRVLSAQIDKMVAARNAGNLEDGQPWDLHGMTSQGALAYVEHLVETTRRRKPRAVLKIITGRGNHSPRFQSVIKAVLLAEFKSRPLCSIKEEPDNEGRLRLVVWRDY